MSVAFKQNGTGLLFLMMWNQSSSQCSDTHCYGGIELGNPSNTAVMGFQLDAHHHDIGEPVVLGQH